MSPEALIYSRDANLSTALSIALRRLKLAPVCAARVGAALNLLRSRKFPAVVVDCQEKDIATDMLELCRNTGSNKSSVVFALTEENETGINWRANFAVKRPNTDLDLRAFTVTLRAAEGMIHQDFRHYRRIPISSYAVLNNDEHSLQLATINLSGGGMCVMGEILGWNKEHTVQLTNPKTGLSFKANSYLVWSRNGRSGIQFRFMTNSAKESLATWLDAH